VIGEEGEDISGILEQADSGDSESTESSDSTEVEDENETKEETEKSKSTGEAEVEETRITEEQEPSSRESRKEGSAQESSDVPPRQESESRLRISPVAQRLASKHNVDVHSLEGSGPHGRIIKRDVQDALDGGLTRKSPEDLSGGQGSGFTSKLRSERKQLSGMRSTIADRMTKAFCEVPHFYLERTLSVDNFLSLEADFSEEHDRDYSTNDLLLFAVSRALCKHPNMNVTFEEDHVQLYDHVDLAFAVAVEDGLFTPIIREADTKSIQQIHDRSQELVSKTRDGSLKPEEYQGGTFTVSNLGMFDVDNFKAVINPPQAGILAIGSVRDEPLVRDGIVTVGKRMDMTLSCDHRSVDGAIGARFLKTLATMIEKPYRMFV
jgi:pyruvate dehydrogenase E2 component (dihydrolipoamide acetyltransferase)